MLTKFDPSTHMSIGSYRLTLPNKLSAKARHVPLLLPKNRPTTRRCDTRLMRLPPPLPKKEMAVATTELGYMAYIKMFFPTSFTTSLTTTKSNFKCKIYLKKKNPQM